MQRSDSQLALDTLAFALGTIPELTEGVSSIAFLRGQPHEGLAPWSEKMVCEQVYKPRATLLEEAGLKLVDRIDGEHDLVLLLPERQREQTLADLARSFDLLKPGGTLVISLHNDWGAKRMEKHLEELASHVETFSKHHCRVFWATKGKGLNKALLEEWRPLADLRRVEDGGFWSKPGLFAWDHVDEGSALLLKTLPNNLHGYVADLGAGWGCLSVQVLKTHENILGLEAFEADRDAVDAARRNIGNVNVPFRPKVFWQDVTQGVGDRRFDFVLMNPPFHEGREPDPTIGMKFISAAARGLKVDGQLWLVANRQLPYEELLQEVFDSTQQVTQDGNYKVIKATMPRHDLFFHRKRRQKTWNYR